LINTGARPWMLCKVVVVAVDGRAEEEVAEEVVAAAAGRGGGRLRGDGADPPPAVAVLWVAEWRRSWPGRVAAAAAFASAARCRMAARALGLGAGPSPWPGSVAPPLLTSMTRTDVASRNSSHKPTQVGGRGRGRGRGRWVPTHCLHPSAGHRGRPKPSSL
jgi:hypothetical protein